MNTYDSLYHCVQRIIRFSVHPFPSLFQFHFNYDNQLQVQVADPGGSGKGAMTYTPAYKQIVIKRACGLYFMFLAHPLFPKTLDLLLSSKVLPIRNKNATDLLRNRLIIFGSCFLIL